MSKCVKCGSVLITVKWVDGGGEFITISKDPVERTEFVSSVARTFDYKVISRKEHLSKTCNCCGYLWRENTKDNL